MDNDNVSGFLNLFSYLLCGSAFFGRVFNFIEQHSAGVLGCVALATYLTSLLFQLLNYRIRVKESQAAIDYELSLPKYSHSKECLNEQD